MADTTVDTTSQDPAAEAIESYIEGTAPDGGDEPGVGSAVLLMGFMLLLVVVFVVVARRMRRRTFDHDT